MEPTLVTDHVPARTPADTTIVNLNEAGEVRYWCKEFDCTEADLQEVVKAMGTSAERVLARFNGRA